jgi:hypothetical protein
MTKITCLTLFAAILIGSLHVNPAQAQRVFVSATGSDSNPCTFASPCRSFQHAHDVAAANGEIDVLDPAGYGPLTITKSISIQAHGFSGVSVPGSGVGIIINATSTDAIHLNGLLIEGNQAGQNGIVLNSGASLTVENCVVRNVTGNGLAFFPNVATTTTLAVSNSYFNNNGNSGMSISPSNSGATTASIERTGFYANAGNGLVVQGNGGFGALSVAVTDSVAANNGNAGFLVESSAGQSITNLSLTHVLSEGNNIGLFAGGANATLWVAQSTVTGNLSAGFEALIAVMKTFQDNYFSNNGPNIGSATGVGKL